MSSQICKFAIDVNVRPILVLVNHVDQCVGTEIYALGHISQQSFKFVLVSPRLVTFSQCVILFSYLKNTGQYETDNMTY